MRNFKGLASIEREGAVGEGPKRRSRCDRGAAFLGDFIAERRDAIAVSWDAIVVSWERIAVMWDCRASWWDWLDVS